MGDQMKVILLMGRAFHLAIAVKNPSFINGECPSDEGSVELTRRMDLCPFFGTNLSLYQAVDNDPFDVELSFHDRRFANDQDTTLEDLSLKLSLQPEDSLKGHLPLKYCLFP